MGALYIARAIKSHNGGWYRWEFSESVYTGEPMLKVLPMSNPVLHRGLLYLLGVDGRLAVYDVSRHEEGFKVLDMPNGFGGFECDDYYLFESDEGELMAVLMGHRGPPKVESLEGRALFTGTLVKAKVRWMQNKIFTPRLYDWPETIRVDLIDKEGELAFVPISTSAAQYGGTTGMNIWSCGLGTQETSKFWETIKVDYSIWFDFST
ncbi:hypothetical protein HU200_042274 [Digitaria exilis]|uniref:Uncharacterized protein n=1 Tax=Digitaria exilis TaxID=1010633 RepID=A0A835ED09_9POAL|nr:hypothetical protein HU200_042274 [Digitaria exilis]